MKEAFASFDQEKLKTEIVSRGINQEQWHAFMKEGKTWVGSGKNQ
jgi:hypothetical protein